MIKMRERFCCGWRVLIMAGLCTAVAACVPTPVKEVEAVAEKLGDTGVLQEHIFEHDGNRVHYVARGDHNKPTIVFIHGTPGDWKMFAHQLSDPALLEVAYLVAIDRPGWAQSTAKDDALYTSLAVQAKLIAPLLEELKNNGQPLIVAGHSLGATLTPYVAMLYPEATDAAVSFAGDLTSAYLETRWYNRLLTWWPFSSLAPDMLINANIEVLALPGNLDEMAEHWRHLSVPYVVYQGGKDTLVDKRNAEFAHGLKTDATVEVNFLPELDHFIHLRLHQQVDQRLVELVKQLESG